MQRFGDQALGRLARDRLAVPDHNPGYLPAKGLFLPSKTSWLALGKNLLPDLVINIGLDI